jgi:hypothetical protein
MFSPKKELEPTKIRLPRRGTTPDLAALAELLSYAREKKGHDVEVTWSEAPNRLTYSLVARVDKEDELPQWILWQADGEQSTLAWRYESSEPEFIDDILYMSRVAVSEVGLAGAGEGNQAAQLEQERANGKARRSDQEKEFAGSMADVVRRVIRRASEPALGKAADCLYLASPLTIEGNLDDIDVPTLLRALSLGQVSGKLEVVGAEHVGSVFFNQGNIRHATTANNSGDLAVVEIVAWTAGTFLFSITDSTSIKSVKQDLNENIMEGKGLRDQSEHLKEAGLTLDSLLVKKHHKLSDSELKVILSKGQFLDFSLQADVYRKIGRRTKLADLLRDRPMEKITMTRALFNFLSCGLIEIKLPEDAQHINLEFAGESKAAMQAIAQSMVRSDSGIISYPALLYLMHYEFQRFEAYGWPLTIILLEIKKRAAKEGFDAISIKEASVAAKRIELVKRPLDTLAHFEALQYALLLPNTNQASGAFVANRILQALTATPLSSDVDCKSLHLAFGIASLPLVADDLETLVNAAKDALHHATIGDFPIVLAEAKPTTARG